MKRILEILHQNRFTGLILLALSEIKLVLVNRFLLGSYSQVKEDLLLDKLTGYKKKGFYVDVGAFDPFRFSNTMRFYRRGWRGINIEPNFQLWKRFDKFRPRDKNLNIAIGEKTQLRTFYSMAPPTLSTFSFKQAQDKVKQGFRIASEKKIRTFPLRQIFKKYVGKRKVDFLSLDVEGFEMSVLKGNDWKRYRPNLLCIETAVQKNDEIGCFLKKVGYTMIFTNGLNSFYKDKFHE